MTMKIVVDRDLCDGHGMCEAMAHEFFELDDDDVLTILNENPDEGDRDKVYAAVQACPALALTLQD
jgi:ferredoxin